MIWRPLAQLILWAIQALLPVRLPNEVMGSGNYLPISDDSGSNNRALFCR